MRRKPLNEAGFTLIELLVVVVIIGILASVAIPNFVGAQDKAKNSGVQSNVHSVQMALEQFGVDNSGVYPDTLTATVVKSGGTYLTAFPKTPWGNQQAADIAADTAKNQNDTLGDTGAAATPTTVTHYGAISYAIPSDATAKEKYVIDGTGKKGDKPIVMLKVQNF